MAWARMRPRVRRKTDICGVTWLEKGRPRAVPSRFAGGTGCNISPVACVFNASMKTIKLLTLATAVAMIAGGLTHETFAADNSTSPPVRGKRLERIAKKLNLTDDQKTQIKTVLKADRDTLATLLGQVHNARRNLRTAIHAGDANETAVRAASAKVASAEADLAVERMKLYGKIAPILTAEQRRQISEFEQRVDSFADNAFARAGDESDN